MPQLELTVCLALHHKIDHYMTKTHAYCQTLVNIIMQIQAKCANLGSWVKRGTVEKISFAQHLRSLMSGNCSFLISLFMAVRESSVHIAFIQLLSEERSCVRQTFLYTIRNEESSSHFITLSMLHCTIVLPDTVPLTKGVSVGQKSKYFTNITSILRNQCFTL